MASIDDELKEEEKLKEQLENNIHYICQRIDPYEFVGPLQQRHIISRQDRDEIMNRFVYPSRYLQAGVILTFANLFILIIKAF